MPCYKCENGKYKFGLSGACTYDTKAQCEAANKDYYAEQTYDDYPQSASNNAKRAIKYKEENGSSCGTQVGWTRARQLANREALTRSTIARMASFKRHQQHKDVPYDEGCGGIMWDAWGGSSGVEWAIRKLEQIDKERKAMVDEEKETDVIFNQEKVEISERIKKALKNKMEKHNEDVKDLKKDWNPKVTMAKLEKCFRRGVGAYYTNPESVREGVTGPDQWALARCNSFLYALRNGRYRSGKHDTDLLPEGHPMRNTKKEVQKNMEHKKYKGDPSHDLHIDISEMQMAKLHGEGMVEMMHEEEGKEYSIKLTYNMKEKEVEIKEEEVKEDMNYVFDRLLNKLKNDI
jgi:ribosome-associated translation inhibitor RaiA|tara:strand:- start:12557 stop:13597 length:1041 start_codon:yes stop_codon:yes gene_type:complete